MGAFCFVEEGVWICIKIEKVADFYDLVNFRNFLCFEIYLCLTLSPERVTMTDFNTVFKNRSNSVKISLENVYIPQKAAILFVILNEID